MGLNLPSQNRDPIIIARALKVLEVGLCGKGVARIFNLELTGVATLIRKTLRVVSKLPHQKKINEKIMRNSDAELQAPWCLPIKPSRYHHTSSLE